MPKSKKIENSSLRPKANTTIKDVARAAGFSIATVSRVLNNVGPIDESTRARVLAASADLRYVPSPLGRNLSTRRTDALGLILPDLYGEFFSEVIRGSDETAQQAKYHLVMSSSHSNREDIAVTLKMMRGRVDGLVIMSPHVDAQTLNMNLTQNLPVVLLNCYVAGAAFDAMNIDNYGGAYAMVRHLLGHGHTRIAIIKGTDRNYDAAERLRGYRMAIASHGGDARAEYEIDGAFSEASGYEAAQNILGLSARPTAIFASNDSMAIGAMSALRDAGVHVPDDMALAGFDDIPIASFLSPALTSVEVGIHNLGVRAIETVVHSVRNKNDHQRQQVLLGTTLRLRESCGCPTKH